MLVIKAVGALILAAVIVLVILAMGLLLPIIGSVLGVLAIITLVAGLIFAGLNEPPKS